MFFLRWSPIDAKLQNRIWKCHHQGTINIQFCKFLQINFTYVILANFFPWVNQTLFVVNAFKWWWSWRKPWLHFKTDIFSDCVGIKIIIVLRNGRNTGCPIKINNLNFFSSRNIFGDTLYFLLNTHNKMHFFKLNISNALYS